MPVLTSTLRILRTTAIFLLVLAAATGLPVGAQQAPFTRQLWQRAEPVYQETLRHPYLAGLADGTLAKAKFQYYLVQDAHYLRVFGQVLSLIAAKAPDEEWALTLNQHAMDTLRAERELHTEILRAFGSDEATVAATPMAPVNVAYTNHLVATAAQRPFIEGLAAVLPCYWVYLEVGKHLVSKGSPDPYYQRWIDQYAGEAYEQSVKQVLAMMDAQANKEHPHTRQRALEIYERSTRYEYLFWDMAWREERWLP